jgi:hypothetical protein
VLPLVGLMVAPQFFLVLPVSYVPLPTFRKSSHTLNVTFGGLNSPYECVHHTLVCPTTLTHFRVPALVCARAGMSREIISPEGLRADGRRANEVRKIECKLGTCLTCFEGERKRSNTAMSCAFRHLHQSGWLGLLRAGQHQSGVLSVWSARGTACLLFDASPFRACAYPPFPCISSLPVCFVFQAKLRSKSLHDRAVITCEYAVSAFSTSQHKKVSKSDRYQPTRREGAKGGISDALHCNQCVAKTKKPL